MTRARLLDLATHIAGLAIDALAWAFTERRAGPVLAVGPSAAHTPAPGHAPSHSLPGARHDPPRDNAPAPALTAEETRLLDAIEHARRPAGGNAARVVADGLREQFPHVDDTTLGRIVLDLHGYAFAAAIGIPDQRAALVMITDVFGRAAEDLTRLARTQEAPW